MLLALSNLVEISYKGVIMTIGKHDVKYNNDYISEQSILYFKLFKKDFIYFRHRGREGE